MDIHELMWPGIISMNLKARRPEEAVRELGSLLVAAGVVKDLDAYLQAVREREALGTTAVGFGVAIPHAKSSAVLRPAVAFGRSTQGIEWKSLDGGAVHMIFLIAAPEGAYDLHLRALAHLARLLMHEEVRQKLQAAEGPDDVIRALA